MRKKIFCAIICAAISGISGFAGDGYDALPYIRIGQDPVRSAMGGAGYAYTGAVAYSSWCNAAAIPFSKEKGGLAAGFNNWQPSLSNTKYISAGCAMNIKDKAGAAMGVTHGLCPLYAQVDNDGKDAGTFRPVEALVNAGGSYRFINCLSAGANVHFAYADLGRIRQTTFTADVFIMGKLKDFTLTAGVSALNFGGNIENHTPTSAAFGAAYGKTFGNKHSVDVLLDADYFFSGEMGVSAGAAYTFNRIVSARAGYHTGGIIPSFLSAGLGVQIGIISLNAAYLLGTSSDEFGNPMKNTFTAGLSLVL